jgi:hypothetical protein
VVFSLRISDVELVLLLAHQPGVAPEPVAEQNALRLGVYFSIASIGSPFEVDVAGWWI